MLGRMPTTINFNLTWRIGVAHGRCSLFLSMGLRFSLGNSKLLGSLLLISTFQFSFSCTLDTNASKTPRSGQGWREILLVASLTEMKLNSQKSHRKIPGNVYSELFFKASDRFLDYYFTNTQIVARYPCSIPPRTATGLSVSTSNCNKTKQCMDAQEITRIGNFLPCLHMPKGKSPSCFLQLAQLTIHSLNAVPLHP